MKYLVLLLLLVPSLCFAQLNSAAGSKTSSAPSKSVPPLDSAKGRLSEKDYYQKMYELAKGEADRAHADVIAGYSVVVGLTIGIVAIIVGIQFFQVKRQLKGINKKVRRNAESLRREAGILTESITVVQNAIPVALSAARHDMSNDLKDKMNQMTETIYYVKADLLTVNKQNAQAFQTYIKALSFDTSDAIIEESTIRNLITILPNEMTKSNFDKLNSFIKSPKYDFVNSVQKLGLEMQMKKMKIYDYLPNPEKPTEKIFTYINNYFEATIDFTDHTK